MLFDIDAMRRGRNATNAGLQLAQLRGTNQQLTTTNSRLNFTNSQLGSTSAKLNGLAVNT